MFYKISIPYNVYTSKERSFGLDAYFWLFLDKKYRKSLLIKPLNSLKNSPDPGSIILSPKIDHSKQLNELEELSQYISSEKIRYTSRLNRWKLARFFLVPLPSGLVDSKELTELVSAENIVRKILSMRTISDGIKWCILSIKETEKGIEINVNGKYDKIYNWLYKNDYGFKNELIKIITKNRQLR
ncbi:MAG: hypothetical protein J7J82_08185 [Staphylothermus sp.]|nr:hypothetical protein [Staphylothermus sp.]